MCTSITYHTIDNYCFLARTMDYDITIPKQLLLIPRAYCWHKAENRVTKYAILGMGMRLANKVGLYDGVNEKGLMCATLMFEDTVYSPRHPDKDNVSTCDFVMWMLSQFDSVEDVVRNLNRINLIFGSIPPLLDACALHWIVSDLTHRTIVIEKTDRLKVYENPYSTLTNEPGFGEQIEHYQRYRCVDPFRESRGLPGDFSSQSRFVRAAYCRAAIDDVSGEADGLTNSLKILDTLQVQKGVDCDRESGPSYTQYTSCICGNSLTYYYNTYENRQLSAVCLAREKLNAKQIKVFPVNDRQSICKQN